MRLRVDAAVVDGTLVPGDVDVSGDRVRAVALAPAGTGCIATAGLVDLQVNGFGGVDLLTADADAIGTLRRRLAATGVTAFQPTLITAPVADVLAAQREIGASRGGARILGIHLEGPFLAPGRTGTHPPRHRRDPDLGLAGRLTADPAVTAVTLAPERPGALDLVDHLRSRGITVAAGHTDATAADAHAAFDRGVRTVTHLFNAMRPLRPRDPGIAAVALARPDVTVQVIADGHHLADDTLRLVWAAAAGRVAIVTDAIAAAGVGDGRVQLGEVEVDVVDGVARRPDGTLAGSASTLPHGLRHVVGLGIPLAAAVDAATRVPAAIVGAAEAGRLEPGGRADVAVLGDDLRVRRVLIAGDAHDAGDG